MQTLAKIRVNCCRTPCLANVVKNRTITLNGFLVFEGIWSFSNVNLVQQFRALDQDIASCRGGRGREKHWGICCARCRAKKSACIVCLMTLYLLLCPII